MIKRSGPRARRQASTASAAQQRRPVAFDAEPTQLQT
jgi:hypothetical protein